MSDSSVEINFRLYRLGIYRESLRVATSARHFCLHIARDFRHVGLLRPILLAPSKALPFLWMNLFRHTLGFSYWLLPPESQPFGPVFSPVLKRADYPAAIWTATLSLDRRGVCNAYTSCPFVTSESKSLLPYSIPNFPPASVCPRRSLGRMTDNTTPRITTATNQRLKSQSASCCWILDVSAPVSGGTFRLYLRLKFASECLARTGQTMLEQIAPFFPSKTMPLSRIGWARLCAVLDSSRGLASFTTFVFLRISLGERHQ